MKREEVLICFVCLACAAAGNNLNKGGHCMEITRNEESRIISVWLTNADQQNEEIQNWLKGKYPVWKKEGYLTVVYKSGHEDLYENTLALLRHNRRLSARKEVEAEKRARKQAEAERLAGKQPAAEMSASTQPVAAMSASAQPAAEMRAGTQTAAEHRAAKPSTLAKLGKKPPAVQSRANQRTRKRSEMER